MLVHLAFSQTRHEGFLVTMEYSSAVSNAPRKTFSTTYYESEDIFIQAVILADLDSETTLRLIATVLRIIAGLEPPSWISLRLTEVQRVSLGLGLGKEDHRFYNEPAGHSSVACFKDLERVLMHATTGFAIVAGPDHRIVLINDPYAHMLGRTGSSALQGKLVRDALAEMAGQGCILALDHVYRTGETLTKTEMQARLHRHGFEGLEERYFDLSYQPMHDSDGTVWGILVHAIDVTEKVLDRQVSNFREAQLYRQWAELETFYHTAPVAMCYFDAKEYRIIRANQIQAETMGSTPENLVGRRVLDIFPDMPGLREMLERVANGESIQHLEYTTDFPSAPGVFRTWLLNYRPTFDGFGEVEMIASIALEITQWIRPSNTSSHPSMGKTPELHHK